MSPKRDSKQPVQRDSSSAPKRDIAAEIVSAIGKDSLLDIKFLIKASSATRDEILEAALKWVLHAEEHIKNIDSNSPHLG